MCSKIQKVKCVLLWLSGILVVPLIYFIKNIEVLIMKIVIQKVNNASVNVDNNIVGKINKGLVVLLGIKNTDTYKDADYLVKKLVNLRVFEDNNGKMNLSLLDINGELLIVSQFTLYAECKKSGNRPSFSDAAKPNIALPLYEYFIDECRKKLPIVETGTFGAHMKLDLINDGPVTIIIDS